ncbi:hypothetical protein [Xanthovirga aplysinae]|uniref:hypothetical protein n=1 Tax=Xanthovirga aplysinae TaxID=2529853 RepID=UPI0012BD59CE|nr:hypothetical protein [Xanthovirga aplysinae]MTI31961.1 hypothetical protein [Xanthovirga aplysinae]
MLEKLKYLPVNWVDGMKINESHFNDLQNHITDLSRDLAGIGLNYLNYGLLPSESTDEMLNISMVIDNHKLLRVKIEQCRGVTVSGARIEITDFAAKNLDFSMPYPELTYNIEEGKEVILVIVLSVYPFERVTVGKPDPDETPPRYPYVVPKYELNLIPEGDFKRKEKSPYMLPIGQIKVSGKETMLVEEYIPPCTMTRCHPKLVETYTQLDSFLGQLELFCVQIAQKINRKNQSSELAELMLRLTETIVIYLGNKITAFRWSAPDSPPSYMFDVITSLARQMKNTIDMRSGAGKEELLNYLSEWCGLSQGQFEILFSDLINNKYEHNDITKTLVLVRNFADTMQNLFSTLNRLDYIGKRKDASIFVQEKVLMDKEANEKLKPKRASFLAD